MDARIDGSTLLPLPAGWFAADDTPRPSADDSGVVSVVSLAVVGGDGTPARLWTVTGDVGNPARRRLRSEQPALDEALRRVAAEPPGDVLLPWLEYGDPRGSRPYLICRRPGPSFADDLRRGPVPAHRVVGTLIRCIEGLQVLHRSGRAHGMIAPAAMFHDAAGVRLAPPLPPALAELVAAAGGTGHEAPEILRGGEPSPAADAFALASSAWTLLSGRPPFGAPDDQLARLTAAEPPSLHRADVPGAMEAALRAGLSPDPSRRPDLRTLSQALHIVAGGAAVTVTPTAPPSWPTSSSPDPEQQDTLAPTRPVQESGQPLGSRYLLDALIGRGATGHVWRGHVRGGGDTVAVKLLRSELAEDPDVVTRFMRERSTLLRLSHPNLVQVRDLVAEGSALAIVMELVDGQDLRREITGGRLDAREAATLLAESAAALAAVHAAGIIHRDLKPENILVERAGGVHARLTDFGLARAVESSVLTHASQLVGTPAYVAPEVVAGREPGPAVDVYALGVTGFELLAGRRPFTANSTAALLRAHLDEVPGRPDGLSDASWEILEACLRKDPVARPTAAAVSAAWQQIASGVTPGPSVLPGPDPAAPPAATPVPSFSAAPSFFAAPPAGSLSGPSGTGALETATAHRPLVLTPAATTTHRSRARLWWVIGAVLVLAFGGGIGLAVLGSGSGSPAGPTSSASLSPVEYPLQVRAVTAGEGGTTTISWTLPPGVVVAQSLIVVYRLDAKGSRTQTGPSLYGHRTEVVVGDVTAGQCIVVFAYNTTKAPPAGAVPGQRCLPAAPAKPTTTGSK